MPCLIPGNTAVAMFPLSEPFNNTEGGTAYHGMPILAVPQIVENLQHISKVHQSQAKDWHQLLQGIYVM